MIENAVCIAKVVKGRPGGQNNKVRDEVIHAWE